MKLYLFFYAEAFMRKKGTLLSLSALCIFLGILTGPLAFAEGIKVGVLLPLTGKLAHFGDIERKSFLMAAKEINGAGGIHGEPIQLLIRDTGGKPAMGKSAIDKLILKDGVCIVGGGFSSSVTWADNSAPMPHVGHVSSAQTRRKLVLGGP